MIFKGEKTFFFRSILWIVCCGNLSLSIFFESKGQDEIIWEKYKVEKSVKDLKDIKQKKQGSNFETMSEDEIIWEQYKTDKSKNVTTNFYIVGHKTKKTSALRKK